MGAPAGLKLNKQLTEFLGHFFLYHIHLWKGIVLSCADLKKSFQRGRGVKGTSEFARGSEAFLGLFNFYHIQKTVLLSNIRIHVLILIEDLYFMYMIILPKDFFQNSLINGFGVQSVLMLSICLSGYLVILQPVLSSVLWSASLLGVLGLTSQLCFLRDVLSMMTLHIYCFYVYAAR